MKTYFKILVSCVFLVPGITNAQNNYSEWYYLRSDKPVQFRLEKTKELNDKVYYKIQLRINNQGAGVCTQEHSLCYGYVVYMPVFEYDLQTKNGNTTEFNYKIAKEFNGVYTVEGEFFASKKNEDKGYLTYWDESLNFPMQKNITTGETVKLPGFLLSCVDTTRNNKPYGDICNNKGFVESTAIEIK